MKRIEPAKLKLQPTLDTLVKRFEQSNIIEGKSIRTIKWYSEILCSFLKYLTETGLSPTLSNYTIDTIRGYLLYTSKRRKYEGHPYISKPGSLSPQTIRGHYRALKAFSSWLYREEITKEQRLKNLRIPRAPKVLVEPLTGEEIKRVLSSIDRVSPTGYRNYTIVITLLDNGLRASEVVGITLGQINMESGYIKVMGKGSKERVVPIGEYVKATLWDYINRGRPMPKVGCDRLFVTRDGRPISTNTIKLIFSRLAKASGVSRLHAHLCRHTFAINYLLNGGDIFSLKEILGHTTLEMVNHYLHFTSSQITAQHHKYSPMDRLQKG